jgi:predicted O-methyltransferase YrrM
VLALRGPAAAGKDYDEVPHGASTLAKAPAGRQAISHRVLTCETKISRLCETARVSGPPDLPPLVRRALDLSRDQGFVSSTRNETGRLLAALAASRAGTMAECGTGCGVGSAWLRSGLRADARIVTAELDHRLAEAVRVIFADDGRVEVLQADWTTLRAYAPFSLLFLDVREAKQQGPEQITELVEPGGVVVLDDFTPCEGWPPMYEGRVDNVRQQWLTDPRFTTAEVMVAPDASVLIAARR